MNSISPKAKIGKNLVSEPFCVIDDDVEIGDNVFIGQGARVANGSRISNNVKILQGAVIASHPHSIGFKDEYSTVEIGEGTWIKEYSTISRATNYSNRTIIGKNCYIMNYVHVAHDNIIGDNVVLTNCVGRAGGPGFPAMGGRSDHGHHPPRAAGPGRRQIPGGYRSVQLRPAVGGLRTGWPPDPRRVRGGRR